MIFFTPSFQKVPNPYIIIHLLFFLVIFFLINGQLGQLFDVDVRVYLLISIPPARVHPVE